MLPLYLQSISSAIVSIVAIAERFIRLQKLGFSRALPAAHAVWLNLYLSSKNLGSPHRNPYFCRFYSIIAVIDKLRIAWQIMHKILRMILQQNIRPPDHPCPLPPNPGYDTNNHGPVFPIPGFGIEDFVILGCRRDYWLSPRHVGLACICRACCGK